MGADRGPAQPRASRPALVALGALVAFALLATLNAGGYRYGASDQAFYIPAIERHLDAALFPRDAPLIDSQSRLFVLDEVLAAVERTLHPGLPALFLTGYVITLALLAAGITGLGRVFFASPWSVAALLAAYTLRHRIAKTGANTLEGYFHPRLLAFAIGVLALTAVLRGRFAAAGVAVLMAGLIHPTTAMWFALWIAVAIFVSEPRARPVIVTLGSVAAVGAALILTYGPLTFAIMDAAWEATLADKDYVFPTAWAARTWAVNLLSPLVMAGTLMARRSRGLTVPRETGLVLGCLALVALFLASLPLVSARVAIAVQLQVSRVFWMADLIATIYVVWWACEAGIDRASARLAARARVVAVALALVAMVRGWYVWRIEHPGRPLVQVTLPADEWTEAAAWLRRTAPGSHVLADPGHAWRYGSSVRVAAGRDVFLENVKDGSIGMYDRTVALRVAERREAVGDLATLSPARLRELAARYDLDYLVTEQTLALPVAHRNARFFIYSLEP